MNAGRALVTLAALALAAAACGDSGGTTADTASATDTAPQTDAPTDTASATDAGDVAPTDLAVVERSPAPDASDVPPHTPIVITFDHDVDPASVSEATVTLETGGNPLYPEIARDGAVVTLTPADPLLNDTTYTVTVTTGVTAADGAPLDGPVTWDFTTLAGVQVTGHEPLADATNVPSFDPVRVHFDAEIDARTVVNGETFQVVSGGWVGGVLYDDEPLPGSVRVVDGDGVNQDLGTTIQWYPPPGVDGGMPEFGVRRDVVVTRGVQTADGATLDAPHRFSFGAYELDPNFYYHLNLEGFGDDYVLGISGGALHMVEDKVSETSQWYIVPLGDGSEFGLWNRGASQALAENGADTAAVVRSWTGTPDQVWSLRDYGGKPGTRKPNESYRVYFLQSRGGGDDMVLQNDSGDGVPDLFMRNRAGNIYSLFYLTRVDRK